MSSLLKNIGDGLKALIAARKMGEALPGDVADEAFADAEAVHTEWRLLRKAARKLGLLLDGDVKEQVVGIADRLAAADEADAKAAEAEARAKALNERLSLMEEAATEAKALVREHEEMAKEAEARAKVSEAEVADALKRAEAAEAKAKKAESDGGTVTISGKVTPELATAAFDAAVAEGVVKALKAELKEADAGLRAGGDKATLAAEYDRWSEALAEAEAKAGEAKAKLGQAQRGTPAFEKAVARAVRKAVLAKEQELLA